MSDSLKEIMRGVRMHLQGRPMDIDDGRYGVSWNDGISGYDMICIYICIVYSYSYCIYDSYSYSYSYI